MTRLARGDRWDIVFNIAEGLRGVGAKSQVPAILEAYDIPCTFSDPLVLALTLHKALTKRVLRDLGVRTAGLLPGRVGGGHRPGRSAVPAVCQAGRRRHGQGDRRGVQGRLARRAGHVFAAGCWRRFASPRWSRPICRAGSSRSASPAPGDQAVAIGTLEIVLLPQAQPHSYTYVNKEQCEELCQFPLAPAGLGGRRRRSWRWRPGAGWVAATPGGWICGPTPRSAARHGAQPAARPAPGALRSADALQRRRAAVPGADSPDHGLGVPASAGTRGPAGHGSCGGDP